MFTHSQSLLMGFFLMTADSSAKSLLRGTEPTATTSNTHTNAVGQQQARRLQVADDDLDANQLQFNLLLGLEVDYGWMGIEQTWATGAEYRTAQDAADAWVNLGAKDLSDANPDFEAPYCSSERRSTEWSAPPPTATNTDIKGKHELLLKYTCTFPELVVPQPPYSPQQFVQDLDQRYLQLSDLRVGHLNTLPQSNQFSFTSSVTKQIVFLEQDVTVDTRFAFDHNFVLPFQLTWDFDTNGKDDDDIATQADYYAVQNATKLWLDTNWDQFYSGPASASRFERRTTQVQVITGSRYTNGDNKHRYSQSVTSAVEIMMGANNITHVPTVAEYTTTMRYFYKIADFLELLEPLLEDDSTLQDIQQTTYAITPSYDVATLEEREERDEAPAPESLKPKLPSIAVVSISL